MNMQLGGPGSSNLGPSLDEEERAMRGGKGNMKAFLIVLVLLVVGGGAALFMVGDDSQKYSEFGRELNGAHRDHFEQFWVCAFQGPPMPEIANNRDFDAEIVKRASRGRNRYGQLVKERCLAKLKDMRPKLDALSLGAPEDLRADTAQLSANIGTLVSAWEDFIVVLDASAEGFDEDATADKREALARAWLEYKRIFGGIQTKLRAKLNG